jgi:hypothetical protein
MEAIKDFTLAGMVPPIQLSPEDHEGGGWVPVWTVMGGKLAKDGERFQAYRLTRSAGREHNRPVEDFGQHVTVAATQ